MKKSIIATNEEEVDDKIQALSQLFVDTKGEEWMWKNEDDFGPRWNFSVSKDGDLINDPCCTNGTHWQGVICSDSPLVCANHSCFVVSLELNGYNLQGPLPLSLSNITNMKELWLGNNKLTGYIPSELGEMMSLQFVYLLFNLFSGPIPSTFGNLSDLEVLAVDYNYLSGPIPESLGKIKDLKWIGMTVNYLTSSIPDILCELSTLERFAVDINLLTGAFPRCLSTVYTLDTLYVSYNSLTGTIHSSLGDMPDLKWLDLDSNLFYGNIPSSLGKLSQLQWLGMALNALSGTIPRDLCNLTALEWFGAHSNLLTGNIPSCIHELSVLEHLDIGINALSGPIPSSIGNFSVMNRLRLDSNHLTGSLPNSMAHLALLDFLTVDSNRLTGTIPVGLGDVVLLTVVDMGDNLLSGKIPQELGSLGALNTLSLSVNCLDSAIPDSFCNLTSIETLSMNGLGGASSCSESVKIPLFGTEIVSRRHSAEIPSCLWTLPRLYTLHLTGNGLQGSLSSLMSTSVVEDLSLAHNRIEGTVPAPSPSLRHIDLSYNRLTGVLSSFNNQSNVSSISMQVNWLSGLLPVEQLQDVPSLDILRGNMFSCSTIPGNDMNSFGYNCGSQLYDSAMYFSAAALVVIAALLIFFATTADAWSVRVLESHRYVPNFQMDESYSLVSSLYGEFNKHRDFYCLAVVAVAVGCAPLHILRLTDQQHEYSTHWNVYSWITSLAFMKGMMMARLSVLAWAVVVSALLCHVLRFSSEENKQDQRRSSHSSRHHLELLRSNSDSANTSRVKIAGLFLFNFLLTVGVNIAYIYCVTELSLARSASFAVRFGMSLYRITSSMFLLPQLTQRVGDPVDEMVFHFRLLLMDNLLIPCIVTAFTSPNCFQELIVEPSSVVTTYSHLDCAYSLLALENVTCVEYHTVLEDTIPFVPAFAYNYQCMSELLTAYVPVLIIGFGMQLLIPMCVLLIITRHVAFDNVPAVFRPALHGLLWPEYSPKEGSVGLLGLCDVVCCDILNPLSVLLTFGLSSPALAFIICLFGVLKMSMWAWAMNRYCARGARNEAAGSSSSAKGSTGSQWLNTHNTELLAECCVPLSGVMRRSFRVVTVYSMVFIMLIYFDASGHVEWEVPLLLVGFSGILIVLSAVVPPISATARSNRVSRSMEFTTSTVANPISQQH